jgi:hypothetical protein
LKGYTLEIQGLTRLQKVFNELPKQARKGIQNELQAIGEEWRGKAITDAPVDRARLKGSINFKVNDLTLEMSAQSRHAAYQEFGTGKQFDAPAILGNYPAQFKGSDEGGDPIANLTAWVKRKGLNKPTFNTKTRKKVYKNKDAAARSIAFAIFKKHQREGMRPKPFLFTGKDGSDRVTFFFSKLKKNIANVLEQVL